MAQTRATSKACRLAFSWIMQLAGYAVTPAEEMTFAIDSQPDQKPQQTKPQSPEKPPLTVVQMPEKKPLPENAVKNILSTIEIYKLDSARVKNWAFKAFRIGAYYELSERNYSILLDKLAAFAFDSGVNPDDIAQKAQEFEESASHASTMAQYADGQEYHDEMRHADTLFTEANRYKLAAEQMRESLAKLEKIAA